MKMVPGHQTTLSYDGAYTLEKEGELEKAIALYEKLLKKSPSELSILTRLMIVYRKLKNYSKEISFIDRAVAIHENKYAQVKSTNARVVSLSKKLNVSLGHTDKRGKSLLTIPEVVKLQKRKEVALKRLK